MFRTSLLKSIPIRSKGFGLEPELTSKIAKRNLRVYEVPVSYNGRTYQEGKKIQWTDGLWALFYILKFWAIDDCYKDDEDGVLHSMSLAPRFNQWMADTINPYLGERILEIGAGIGNLTSNFLPRDKYTASDINPVHLQTLRSRFQNNRRVQVKKLDLGNSKDCESEADSVDTIVCLNVLEHIKDDRNAMKNMYEMLEVDGRAIVLVPQGQQFYGTLDEAVGHFKRYCKADLAQLMTDSGFIVEQMIEFNRPGLIGWYLNGKLLKKRNLNKLQLKIYDHFVWLFRHIDNLFPWPALSIIAIGRKK